MPSSYPMIRTALLVASAALAILDVNGAAPICQATASDCYKPQFLPKNEFVSNFRYSPDFQDLNDPDNVGPSEIAIPPEVGLALPFLSLTKAGPVASILNAIANYVITGAAGHKEDEETPLVRDYERAIVRNALQWVEEEAFQENLREVNVKLSLAINDLKYVSEHLEDQLFENMKTAFGRYISACLSARATLKTSSYPLEEHLTVLPEFCNVCGIAGPAVVNALDPSNPSLVDKTYYLTEIEKLLEDGLLELCKNGETRARELLDRLATRVTDGREDQVSRCEIVIPPTVDPIGPPTFGGTPVPRSSPTSPVQTSSMRQNGVWWRADFTYRDKVRVNRLKSSKVLGNEIVFNRLFDDTWTVDNSSCTSSARYRYPSIERENFRLGCACRYKERINFEAYQVLQRKVISMSKGFQVAEDRALANQVVSLDSNTPQAYKEIEVYGVDGSRIHMRYVRRGYFAPIIEDYYAMIDQDMDTFADVNLQAPQNGRYAAMFEFQSDIDIAEIHVYLQNPPAEGSFIQVNVNRGSGYVTAGEYWGSGSSVLGFVVRPAYAMISRGPVNNGAYYHMDNSGSGNFQNLTLDGAGQNERFQFRLRSKTSSAVNIISLVGAPGCLFNHNSNAWENIHGHCFDDDHPHKSFAILRGGIDDSTYRIRGTAVKQFMKSQTVTNNLPDNSKLVGRGTTDYVDDAARVELAARWCYSSCVSVISSTSSSSTFEILSIGGGIFAMGAIAVLSAHFHGRRRRTRSESKRIKEDLAIDPSTDF